MRSRAAPCSSGRPGRSGRGRRGRRHRRLEETPDDDAQRGTPGSTYRAADGRRIVDLSMPVHPDMLTFPRVPPPTLCVNETHEQFAERIGAEAVRGRQADRPLPRGPGRPRRHALRRAQAHRPRRRRSGDDPARVLLRRRRAARLHLGGEGPRHQRRGDRGASSTRSATSSSRATSCSSTPAPAPTTTRSATRPTIPGMTAEATRWLIERGVRMMGIDAITFDPPVWAMFEQQAVLGGPPRHVGRGVLAPREPHEPRADRPAVRLPALRPADQVGRHDRRAGACRSRSWRTERVLVFFDERALHGRRPRRRQGRVAGAHDRARHAGAARLRRARRRARGGARGDGGGDPRGARPRRGRRPGRVAEEAQALVRAPTPAARSRRRSPRPTRALGDGDVPVAVRSSATAEDSEAASFAGQQETYLHVRGVEDDRRAHPRLLGLVLHRARAVLPRAEGLARRPRHGRRRPADGRSPTSPGVHVHDRPDQGPARPHGRRGGLRARRGRRLRAADARPLRRSPATGGSSARGSHTQPYAIVHDPAGGIREEPLPPERGEAQTLAEEQLARLAKVGDRARGAARRPAGHRVGDRRTTSSSSCSRAR